MSKRPWFKLYPSDALHGIRKLPPLEIAVYWVCLFEMYDTEDGWIDLDIESIAIGCNMRKDRAAKVVEKLISRGKFVVDGARMTNERVQKEFGNVSEIAQKAADNARKRWRDKSENTNKNNKANMRAHDKQNARSDADGMLTRSQKPETRTGASAPDARAGAHDPPPFDIELPECLDRRRDDVQSAFDDYNAMAQQAGLPLASALTETRRGKLKARLKVAGPDGWRQALAMCAASAHCRGENDRGWRADLDFILRESKFHKLLEGSYDNAPPKNGGPPGKNDALRRAAQNVRDRDERRANETRDDNTNLPPGGYLPANRQE